MDNKPSILFTLPWSVSATGGVNQVVLNLARETERRGQMRPIIVCSDWDQEGFRFGEIDGITTVSTRLRTPVASKHAIRNLAGFAFTMRKSLATWQDFMRHHRVRVVNAHYAISGYLLFSLLRRQDRADFRLIHSLHGADLSGIQAAGAATRATDRWMLRQADHVVCCSDDLSLQARATLNIDPVPVSTVHNGIDFAELMRNADTALYRAKQDGRNTRVLYDQAMNAALVERLILETDLRGAIAAGHLRAYFQPKVRLGDQALVGAEALMRWFHPERGLIPPDQFIPVAEASHLIITLGDWMLAEVCRQLAAWRRQGWPPLVVAVNLAARHFRQPGLADRIRGLLEVHGLSPHILELELTESTLLELGAQTEDTLRSLKQLGVGLAIDDFGTGYSSLSYLKRLPLTALKIDRGFVRDLAIDPDDRALVATIVAIGHQMNMVVVAEGVETEDQRHFLLEQGCDLAQGYLFGRPMPVEEFVNWLASASYELDPGACSA